MLPTSGISSQNDTSCTLDPMLDSCDDTDIIEPASPDFSIPGLSLHVFFIIFALPRPLVGADLLTVTSTSIQLTSDKCWLTPFFCNLCHFLA